MIFLIFALFVFDLVIQIKVPIKKKKNEGDHYPQGPINHPCIFRLLPLKSLWLSQPIWIHLWLCAAYVIIFANKTTANQQKRLKSQTQFFFSFAIAVPLIQTIKRHRHVSSPQIKIKRKGDLGKLVALYCIYGKVSCMLVSRSVHWFFAVRSLSLPWRENASKSNK